MDAVGIGAAGNLSAEGAKGIFQLIVKHFKYVINYQDNVNKYNEKLNTLTAKRKSVKQEVDAATRNAEKIKADVEEWCQRVDKAIDEDAQKKVKDLEEKAKKNCFIGLCPRYKLSKKAEEDAATFDQLQQAQFNGVAYRDVPQSMAAPLKDFEAFKSREKVLNDIMEAVKDGNISVIGVYGKEGVGKTTLVNEVARQAKKAKLFDWVVRADVTQSPDVEKIQDQIAESLGLNLKEKSKQARAARLFERLKNETKILVVLDHVWNRLELDEVGISKCKIIVMSREEDVVSNLMDAEKSFEVCRLEETEAWELFKKIAGKIDQSNGGELVSIAKEIAQNCGGIPADIAQFAKGLRNKPVFEWKNALLKLKRRQI